ncbi:MAG: response regulator [Magnetococcales bacterium]|nr:response regulator [Magnetococcales bacterium]
MPPPVAKPTIILMAEDNRADQRLAERAMRKTQLLANFVMVADGEEALAFLRDPTQPLPDLILLDINMPVIDGYRFLEIRQAAKEPWTLIPVIMLTTSDQMDDVNACYALGANAYLRKSTEIKELIEVLMKLYGFWLQIAVLPNEPSVPTDSLLSS